MDSSVDTSWNQLLLGCAAAAVLGSLIAHFLARRSAPKAAPDALQKPFSRLAVHADLPRLHLSLDDKDFAQESSCARVAGFLGGVLRLVGDKRAASMEQRILAVGRDEVLPEALLSLLEELEESAGARVLKACTQSAVAATAIKLKLRLTGENGFNGQPGSWRCAVLSEPAGGVRVVHRKSEQGRQLPYTFEWRHEILLDSDGRFLDRTTFLHQLHVDDAECDDPDAVREIVAQAFAQIDRE